MFLVMTLTPLFLKLTLFYVYLSLTTSWQRSKIGQRYGSSKEWIPRFK